MKRWLWVLLEILVLTMVFSACTSENSETGPDGDADWAGEFEAEDAEPGCDDITFCHSDFDCPETCLCTDGQCVSAEGKRFDLASGNSRLIYRHDKGRVELYSGTNLILQHGTGRVWLDDFGSKGKSVSVSDLEERAVERLVDEQNRLVGLKITGKWNSEAAALTWTIKLDREQGNFTFSLSLANRSQSESISLAKFAPLVTSSENGGGLFLGEHPSTHRILENGSYTYMDHIAEIRTGDCVKDSVLAAGVPGDFNGDSVSNWNHAVMDLDSGRIWVAGALTFYHASPVFNLSYQKDKAVVSQDGKTGFSLFSAEMAYLPHRKNVAAEASFDSEPIYVHVGETNIFDGLERYALAVKKEMGITLWTERNGGQRVPNGWNSWSGSGGTGGYGQDINEDVMLANLDVMAEEFKDFGVEWFQIDDGWQMDFGKWEWRTDRFPHGPKWMTDRIREKGLRPGLWMAPLTAQNDSQTVKDHSEWFTGKTALGGLLAQNYTLFDFTKPEVKDYVRNLLRSFKQDWGFEWLKMDFAYWAILAEGYSDESQTREEMYRGIVNIIREELGDNAFFLAVALMGPHYGLVDADRITLDNLPVWDWQPEVPAGAHIKQQGFKPVIRTAARRFYLNHRIWINHPDLIMFRSNTNDESWPRVTLNETQAYASYVGLTGGIVKMGDKLVDLNPEQINSVRVLLPIYAKGARPLDLFIHEFPERWHLKVEGGTDGYDEKYDLVGLFNWGRNWDLSSNPFTEIPDTRTDVILSQALPELGLEAGKTYLAYEFWTGEFLGEIDDTLSVSIPSHSARVIALRQKRDRPQFLGWNRHLTMGATDLRLVAWDASTSTLTFNARVVKGGPRAPFSYRVVFFVPEGFQFLRLEGETAKLENLVGNQEGKLLTLSFSALTSGECSLKVVFGKE